MDYGLGCRVQGLGFRVQGFRLQVSGLEFRGVFLVETFRGVFQV